MLAGERDQRLVAALALGQVVADGVVVLDRALDAAGDHHRPRRAADLALRQHLVVEVVDHDPGLEPDRGVAALHEAVVKTLESLPRDATHWSTRSMAKESGLTAATMSRIWRAFCIKPHRYETFKLSRDTLFIDQCPDLPIRRATPSQRQSNSGGELFERSRHGLR